MKKGLVLLLISVVLFFAAYGAIVIKTDHAWVSWVALVVFGLPVLVTINLRLLIPFFSLGCLAFFWEWLSITTGFPYGFFTYGDNLGPKVFGMLPIILPLTWPVLVFGTYILVCNVRPFWKKILVGASILTMFDLVLDPVAVSSVMWVYREGGPYFDVPISNFFGWFLTGLLAMILLHYTVKNAHQQWRYSLWMHVVFWSGCAVWAGLTVPAIIGIVFTCILSYQLVLKS